MPASSVVASTLSRLRPLAKAIEPIIGGLEARALLVGPADDLDAALGQKPTVRSALREKKRDSLGRPSSEDTS